MKQRRLEKLLSLNRYLERIAVRSRIGTLADRRLKPGEWRAVTAEEVRALAGAVKAPTDPH